MMQSWISWCTRWNVPWKVWPKKWMIIWAERLFCVLLQDTDTGIILISGSCLWAGGRWGWDDGWKNLTLTLPSHQWFHLFAKISARNGRIHIYTRIMGGGSFYPILVRDIVHTPISSFSFLVLFFPDLERVGFNLVCPFVIECPSATKCPPTHAFECLPLIECPY